MKNKYAQLIKHIQSLYKDIYPQPVDEGHNAKTIDLIEKFVVSHLPEIKSVLDVGCGQGNAYGRFKQLGIKWQGLTAGYTDYQKCLELGLPVTRDDMAFTNYEDKQFDLVFARHVLEHSPMPLIALLEWHRLAKKYLIVVIPNPESVVVGGRNHYYMLTPPQWNILFKNSGWIFESEDNSDPEEFRFLLRKGKNRVDFYNCPII